MTIKLDVVTLDNKKLGSVELKSELFALPVREDILHRVVNWQLAKRRAGTHKTKGRSEVHGTTKKMYKQKGTGNARHGAATAPQFRGGGTVFGPLVRDHGYSLPKKIRALGLKTALSAKQAEGKVIVLKEANLKDIKTSQLAKQLSALGLSSALILDGAIVDTSFKKAVANIPQVDILPGQGANVYDILRHDTLVLTEAGIKHLEERLA
ncbi:MAG: rplD [Rickettsiales bacterium]|jgi:large subunit ribosomal protein L4|nr:rplD [Rickettsiales bacterium]